MVHDAVEETVLIASFASSTFELRIPLIADALSTQARAAFHSVACGLHADKRIGSRSRGVAQAVQPSVSSGVVAWSRTQRLPSVAGNPLTDWCQPTACIDEGQLGGSQIGPVLGAGG